MDWAMTQNNLGNLLARLGALTGDAATLARAKEACCEALEEFTRERAPMDWALTQNNLGRVLRRLGDLSGDAETLARAEAAYREALDAYAASTGTIETTITPASA
jgi:tetratricopeptide (TPR) repeat protein